jgi:hypothetical protein
MADMPPHENISIPQQINIHISLLLTVNRTIAAILFGLI